VPKIELSAEAEVIVIILDPTQSELYSAFGHSAFRVHDPINKVDKVFNYGIFDFDQPNFYLNFTKGKLYYKLGTGPYPAYKNYYFRTNRSFREHILNISLADKQSIYDFLIDNAKPENANYYYNYCYDNCATRMRDVLNEVFSDRVNYDYSYANDSLTFRGLMDRYLEAQPWGDLGIDICLGSQIDEIASGPQYTYQPEFLERAILSATLRNDSTMLPLVLSSATINTSDEYIPASKILPIHVFIFIFFLVGIITHRGMKYQVNYRFIDILLYGITGILGVCLLLLWLATDHLSTWNYNLIWAMPLNIVALILLLKNAQTVILKWYFFCYAILMFALIVFRELLLQELHFALIPFVLALILRSFYLSYELRKEIEK
jgi:hypothetical protein